MLYGDLSYGVHNIILKYVKQTEFKKVIDSQTEQVQILMPEHINGEKRLFGGKLVEWIDIVAAVVARRHSNKNVILTGDTEWRWSVFLYAFQLVFGSFYFINQEHY